jgi:hypothetical protein
MFDAALDLLIDFVLEQLLHFIIDTVAEHFELGSIVEAEHVLDLDANCMTAKII